MTLDLTLSETTVQVVAGASAPLTVLVANSGPQVAEVRLEVAGRAAPWLQVAAPDGRTPSPWTRVEPGQSASLPLLVAPPRGSGVPGQLVPFSVRAVTAEDGRTSAAATGLVLLAAPVPVTAAVLPASARTAGPSSHAVELTTDQPAGVLVTLRGVGDPPDTAVLVDPVALRVEHGRPSRADVTVRPRRPAVLRTRQHGFEVVWETEGPEGLLRGTARGRLDQVPALPPVVTVLLAVLLLAGVVVGAAALWPDRSPAARQDGGAVDGVSESEPGTAVPGGGPVAVVHAQLKGQDPDASRRAAEQRAQSLQVPPDLRTAVVDGAGVRGWSAGFWLVVVQGFSGDDAAQRFCRTPPAGAERCLPA